MVTTTFAKSFGSDIISDFLSACFWICRRSFGGPIKVSSWILIGLLFAANCDFMAAN